MFWPFQDPEIANFPSLPQPCPGKGFPQLCAIFGETEFDNCQVITTTKIGPSEVHATGEAKLGKPLFLVH